eukprot:jgi/Chlat1/780/Chrsp104S01251
MAAVMGVAATSALAPAMAVTTAVPNQPSVRSARQGRFQPIYASTASSRVASTSCRQPAISLSILKVLPGRHSSLLKVSGTHCRRSKISHCSASASTAPSESSSQHTLSPGSPDKVLVAGGTGGVGQLLVAKLLERGYSVRAMVRSIERARALFGEHQKLQLVMGDTRYPEVLSVPSMWDGVGAVICCTGTTAFPSSRWDGDNTPKNIDLVGASNLIKATPKTVKRFMFASSIGVERANQFPFLILNLNGVLTYKGQSEELLRSSGLAYTIIRPARLTDGPYTSYDLNTLLKATSGSRQRVVVGKGDKLSGEVSRIAVAEAFVQALQLECTCNQTYELESTKGDGPGKDTAAWERLYLSAGMAQPSIWSKLQELLPGAK